MEVPGEKPLGARERANNKLNAHMALMPGFEPGRHWWEVSSLTTTLYPCSPPLLSNGKAPRSPPDPTEIGSQGHGGTFDQRIFPGRKDFFCL